jgi:hypothetical protein
MAKDAAHAIILEALGASQIDERRRWPSSGPARIITGTGPYQSPFLSTKGRSQRGQMKGDRA